MLLESGGGSPVRGKCPGGHAPGKCKGRQGLEPSARGRDYRRPPLPGRRQWEWFATLTFREDVPPELADRRLRRFIATLNRCRYGPRWWKHGQGVWWVRALEYQQRGVVHLHVLLAGIEGLPRQTAIRCWRM